jgi:hypothetical protein
MASIAVSAAVLPSRLLRAALLAFALCTLLACAAVLWPGAAFHQPYLIASFCALACALALQARSRHRKAHQIDISGLGQIRLTVQLSVERKAEPETVHMLPASTLWPGLLLLLLRDAGGVVTPVLVLPDSVAPDTFRALSVACRAISRRHEPE